VITAPHNADLLPQLKEKKQQIYDERKREDENRTNLFGCFFLSFGELICDVYAAPACHAHFSQICGKNRFD
jgi:hypothetical protein